MHEPIKLKMEPANWNYWLNSWPTKLTLSIVKHWLTLFALRSSPSTSMALLLIFNINQLSTLLYFIVDYDTICISWAHRNCIFARILCTRDFLPYLDLPLVEHVPFRDTFPFRTIANNYPWLFPSFSISARAHWLDNLFFSCLFFSSHVFLFFWLNDENCDNKKKNAANFVPERNDKKKKEKILKSFFFCFHNSRRIRRRVCGWKKKKKTLNLFQISYFSAVIYLFI